MYENYHQIVIASQSPVETSLTAHSISCLGTLTGFEYVLDDVNKVDLLTRYAMFPEFQDNLVYKEDGIRISSLTKETFGYGIVDRMLTQQSSFSEPKILIFSNKSLFGTVLLGRPEIGLFPAEPIIGHEWKEGDGYYGFS